MWREKSRVQLQRYYGTQKLKWREAIPLFLLLLSGGWSSDSGLWLDEQTSAGTVTELTDWVVESDERENEWKGNN